MGLKQANDWFRIRKAQLTQSKKAQELALKALLFEPNFIDFKTLEFLDR